MYVKTFAASAALVAMLSGPALAQSLADTTGETVKDTTAVVGDTVSDTGTAIKKTGNTLGNTVAGADDARAEGSLVVSADAETIGTVESAETDANGDLSLIVNVDSGLGLPVRQVRLAAETQTDGSYEIAMSRAQFIAAVQAHLDTRASDS